MSSLIKKLFHKSEASKDGLNQPQREAIVDLLNYCMYADNFVFLVDQTRQPAVAVKTPVTVGIRERGIVEVTSGLHSGDLVITDGVLKVRPNGPVKVQSQERPAEKMKSGDARVAVDLRRPRATG